MRRQEAKLYRARYLLPIAAPTVEDGALLVEGGRIAAVGPYAALRRADAELVDFGDAILLPPLVNAHTHLELTHFPQWSRAAGEERAQTSFVDWILQLIRVKRAQPLEAFRPSLDAGIAQSLAAGTGAVGDIVSFLPARKAFQSTPLRGRVYLELLGHDPARCRSLLEGVASALDAPPGGRVTCGLTPHSPYNLSESFLAEVFEFGRRRQLPFTIHLAESSAESEFLERSEGPIASGLYPGVGWGDLVPPAAGLSAVRYLRRCGGLHAGTLLVHGVHVTQDDVRLIAASGAALALCPRSNARLDVGRAPVEAYLAAGVRLVLGTDSLASNDTLSVWDEIAFARGWFGGALDGPRLLAMATIDGARTLGLEGEMGALAPGWGAHFQLLRPATLPSFDELPDYLCAPGRSSEVQGLWLDGRDVLQCR